MVTAPQDNRPTIVLPNGTTQPPPTNAAQWALQAVFEQVVKYGLATVLAVALVGLLVYERIETDKSQTALIGKVIELQVANGQVTIDTQRSLAEARATQVAYVDEQRRQGRTLEQIVLSQQDMVRRLESLQRDND